MVENSSGSILNQLVELSKLDVLIAGLKAQRKTIETETAERRKAISSHEVKRTARARVLDDRRALCVREDKAVKVERERINERRKALNTLSNYKLQQAAEREIDYVSKQVGQREEVLLGVMREVELLEKDVAESNSTIEGLTSELTAFEQDANATIKSLDEQVAEHTVRRNEIVGAIGVNPGLAAYNRIKDRFPSNPIVGIFNRDTCSGCHMKLGPQVIVQVARGEVVKCPGCGRILRLAEESAS